MMWKNREVNMYPIILLSDCFIEKISIEVSGDIILDLSKYGFSVLIEQKKSYYRTNGAQIRLKDCCVDDISIEEIRTQKLNESTFFKTMYDIEVSEFMTNVNENKWSFEIVDEYYGIGSGFFTARIGPEDDTRWCYIKICFKSLEYLWNDVQYDWPF